jgi:hypothetical protein
MEYAYEIPERGKPVPYTGRMAHRLPFRSPRHIGAKRNNLRTIPPDDYDDMEISADRVRNWKKHRGTQYKG